MGALPVLRGLTLAVRLALAAGSVLVAARIRHGVPRAMQNGWVVVAVVYILLACGTLTLEGLAILAHFGAGDAVVSIRAAIYNEVYMGAGVAFAILPALLLVVFAEQPWVRWAGLVGLSMSVAIGVAGLAVGAVTDWEVLLSSNRVLVFVGIAEYLLFCGLYLLDRLSTVERYLAAVVITETVLQLLIPVPEVFFQAAGPQDAAAIWHIIQTMQLVAGSVQLAFVWAALRALRRGGAAELLRGPFRS